MFLRYIHSFRALAIIFIVAAHCIALFDWASIPWQRHLVLSLIPNGTVFFVFIAGFLFQHLSYKFEYRRYLKSKLQNVGVLRFHRRLPLSAPVLQIRIPTLPEEQVPERHAALCDRLAADDRGPGTNPEWEL